MKKAVICLLALVLALAGCEKVVEQPEISAPSVQSSEVESSPALNRYQGSFLQLFDTVTFVVGYTKDEAMFQTALDEIKAELGEYHKLYDIYNEYPGINNLATLNKNAGIAPVKVDVRIIDLLEFGKVTYDNTGGLTNMAMGSVLKLWHDARTAGIDNPEEAKLPDREKVEAAALHTDIDQVIIDRQAGTVFLADPEMSLDVGSIGKGYAVERVAQTMEAKGRDHFLISVGGNVRAIGHKPDGALWTTGIENAYGEEAFLGIVQLDGFSLVTSGTYQRYYTVDGVEYHHIIHPESLMPEHYMRAVAIYCKDSGRADALSTAVFNMPLEEGQAWVESQEGVEAMWMLEDRTLVYSSGFEALLKEDS